MKNFNHLKTFENFTSNYDILDQIEKELSEKEFDRFLNRLSHMSVEEVQAYLRTLKAQSELKTESSHEELDNLIDELPDYLIDRLSHMSVGEIQEMLRNIKQDKELETK